MMKVIMAQYLLAEAEVVGCLDDNEDPIEFMEDWLENRMLGQNLPVFFKVYPFLNPGPPNGAFIEMYPVSHNPTKLCRS
jgi:hypothetical protein